MPPDELIRKLVAFADDHGAGGDPFPVGAGSMTLVRQRQPTLIYPVVYRPIFCLVLQGEKQTYLGSQTVRFGAMQSLIVGLDLPAQARVVSASRTEPYVALALPLDMALIRELALEIDRPGKSSPASGAVASGRADAAIVDAMRRLFELSQMPEAGKVLLPLLLREIHYWLLTAKHGAILRQVAEQDSHAARIARVIAGIRRDIAASLRVDDLAGDAGMSVSAFHAHFKELTGTSPLQFQKQLRLMEARRLLQAEKLSVSRAAFQVGYESPTQFSREYSRHFGLPPRADKAQGPSQAAL
ncbi:Transcriptional Regulator, AraC family protein [Stappia aggregata IAM 12614]|uniref:Transcriptional Regulator, AraC family protein n=1 Tax=Roseibium aggregatum (strain ATCC 25650 / DSM 13394 / JCM 20685 / NBRC 16684 / NCIMB 2208 / IAM 12614 / B1) TaxID=384765 RepID=A0NVI5_ROSAI|nr:AraC family transcriptional regulator [Roseibium aggregatum]EAV43000.1 Transcriptional Regulator, AraC family protein [Stappia aggregata IAM 12614] [Roseibium aggregatum IAM 12614]